MNFNTPDYTQHYDDKVNILICQIKIWNPQEIKGIPKQNEKGCITLHEVGSIEVNQSYKDVISTATVSFPRGTIIRKFETSFSANPKTEGSDTNTTQSSEKGIISDASGNNQPIFTTISKDYGVIQVKRSTADKELEAADLKVGYRIQIKCGYTDDPNYADNIFPYEDNPNGKYNGSSSNTTDNKFILLFTGYISKISATTPIQLECEDMAHYFKVKGVPRLTIKNTHLNDFIFPGKSTYLLKGCPVKINESIKKENIQLGRIELSKDLVVADVLAEWSKSGLFCFMRREGPLCEPELFIGRAYLTDSDEGQTNNIQSILYRKPGIEPTKIQMDWDVAEDNLNIINVDPKFLGVRATGPNGNNGFINLTVIPDEDDPRKYRIVNVHEGRKKAQKKKHKKDAKKEVKKVEIVNRVDLSMYTIIPFQGVGKPEKKGGFLKITKEELAKQAWTYYNQRKYKTSGIDGSVTVFGDLDVQPTDIISIVDMHQPVRNGFYMVGEVKTTFGVNGYRKELTLPFKITNFKDNILGIEIQSDKNGK